MEEQQQQQQSDTILYPQTVWPLRYDLHITLHFRNLHAHEDNGHKSTFEGLALIEMDVLDDAVRQIELNASGSLKVKAAHLIAAPPHPDDGDAEEIQTDHAKKPLQITQDLARQRLFLHSQGESLSILPVN